MTLSLSKSVLLASLGVFTSSLFLTSSYAVEIPPGVKLAQKQDLGYNLGKTPETLDPGVNTDWGSQQIEKCVFDTLVRQDNTGKLVGVGAESWETSADGLTWTFHLRKDATWTDGKPVVAKDYIYAWQRVLDPKTASLGSDLFIQSNIVNANAIQAGKLPPSALGVKALDPYTLQISLSKVTPWFLDILTFLNTAPVRKDIIDKWGNSWTRPEHIVSNGPYRLQANQFNDYLLLTKRADYWDAKNIYINNIKFSVLGNPNGTYYSYLAGDFYTTRIPAQFLPTVLKERPEEIIQEPYPSTYAVILNTQRPMFQDARVRRALFLLFDRQFITSKIYRAYTPTTVVAPTILTDGQNLTQDEFALDNKNKAQRQAQAIQLLKEAGYTKEHPLTFTWLYNKGRDAVRNNVALAGMLQDFSGDLIKVNLKITDKNTYYQDVARRDFDAVYYIMNPDYYHASTFFRTFLPNNANNFSGWTNPTYTSLYQYSEDTQIDKERQNTYEALNLLLQQKAPVIPIMLAQRFILKSPALGGFNGKLPFTYMRDYYIIADKHIAKPQN